MAIGPVGQIEAPSAARPMEGQVPREGSRVREELQQNVAVKDITLSSPGFALPAEGQQAAGEKRATPQQLADAVKKVNDHLQSLHRELQFNLDDQSGRVVIKVVDTETQEVIRQIPSEDILALSEHLSEDKGLLLHLDV